MLTLVFGIVSIVQLFKPQKVIIDKSTNNIKIEPKSVDHLTGAEPSSTKIVSLKKLKPLETGKHLNELPDNIYGFVHAWALSWDLKMPKNEQRMILSNERQTDYFFEVQKFNNRFYLVGFIGDESYANIGKVNKSNVLELTLFALPRENFKNLVAIPFESISKIDDRDINIGTGRSARVFDIVTNNIISDIQGHDLNIK